MLIWSRAKKMKSIIPFSAIILLTFANPVFGQEEESKPIKKVVIRDFFVQTGFYSGSNSNGTLTDFKTLAPQSLLLNNSFTDYSQSGGYSTGNNMFSVMLGIQFRDKQKTAYKTNPLLRLGISYFNMSTLSGYLYKQDRKPYDTLISAQTGQPVYIDSVTSKNYNLTYSSEQLRFDGSLIFRTNPKARWSLYSGIGFSAGISMNAKTHINYSKHDRLETRFPNTSTFFYNNFSSIGTSTFENYRNQNNFGLSVYIPMGIDFRTGTKKEFWKRIHLFYELRPGLNITSIPELHTEANTNIQYGLGLRVTWN